MHLRFLGLALAVVAVLVCLVFLAVRMTPSPVDNDVELWSGATNRLRSIYVFIAGEFWLGEGAAPNLNHPKIQTALQELASRGFTPLDFKTRDHSRTNWVLCCVNPDSSAWARPAARSNEIAAYWPVNWARSGASPRFAAVTFAGQVVAISNYPHWTPLPWDSVFLTNNKSPSVSTSENQGRRIGKKGDGVDP